MWKIALGFVVFAAIALFVIMKAGDKIEMGGEQHTGDIQHPPSTTAAPAAPAPAKP